MRDVKTMADETSSIATDLIIRLSLREKLDLVPAIFSVVASAFYHVIAGLFRGKTGAKGYRVHVWHAISRKVTSRLSLRQTSYLDFPTKIAYRISMKSRGVKPVSLSLPHGAAGHWIGNKDAKNVVIYYHGGGFNFPASTMHFSFFYSEIVKPLNKEGHDVAFFFLEYTLTPCASYPTQLRQAVEGLRYILDETKRLPSSVILGGDSAGANLVMAVLLHLSHPHPEIEPLDLEPGQKLAGAFACAPWVSFSMDWPSIQNNKHKDIIHIECLRTWAAAYLNGKQPDNWSEPMLAPTEWWKDVMADHVLFVAGTDEVLISGIEMFVKKFKSVNPEAAFFLAPGETHIAHVYSAALSHKKPQQGEAVKSWLEERV
ncbi:hypothetical protein MAP00_009093 [Monascus purpureus]|nr:hypothetical protein MAP00_009093 [Monascus purpureus]